jgi:sucrose phosphorylase
VQEHGGLVSFRTEEDGSQTPYELNCSYIDALSHPEDDDILRIRRMLVSQGTALAMPGVPGIYFHSLVGSRNYHDGVKHTGINRSINREKYNVDWLEKELYEQGNLAKTMFDSYKRLISIRTNEKAFDPFGSFRFFADDPRLFVIEQVSSDDKERILAVHNFSNEAVSFSIADDITLPLRDLLSSYVSDETRTILLEPYQMMWLKGNI